MKLVTLLLIAIALASLPSPAGAPTPSHHESARSLEPSVAAAKAGRRASGTATQVSDDFNDGNANGWVVVNDSGTTAAWSVRGGKYRQSRFVGNFGPALFEGYHRGTHAFLQSQTGAANYRLSAEVTPLAGSGEEVGLLFYYQNNSNYYRFVTSFSDGFTRLEKRVGGNFQTLARNARGYPPGTVLRITVDIRNGVIQVTVNGERLMSAYDRSLTGGTVGLYTRDEVSFDNVVLVPSAGPPRVMIAAPTDRSVLPETVFRVEATVLNAPATASVAFDLDGSAGSCSGAAQPKPGWFTASCSGAPGVHTLSARLFDRATAVDVDRRAFVATGGNVYVTIGDSNTWGEGDRFSQDGNASGGWVRALHGYQANLVNDLNAAGGRVSIAFNEAVRGDTLARVLSDRLGSYLERNAGANFAIVLLGTNDAGGSAPVASGLHCSGRACDGTFKGRLGALVGRLRAAGMTPIVVQVPPRWGDTIGTPPYGNPAGHPVNATIISEYNRVIRGEDANPLSGFVVGPNLFHYYLGGGSNRFHLFFDNLHPSGLGLAILAAQLKNVILGGSALPFALDDLCVRVSSGAACATPTPYKQDLLEAGDQPWVDNGSALTSIPSLLAGGRWIRTAHADKSRSNSNYLSFRISRKSTVYVAVDADAAPPSWLASRGFKNTGATVRTNLPGAGQLRLYSKRFGAGTVTLGGADAAATGASANLLAIVK